jgi:hypothetical protein
MIFKKEVSEFDNGQTKDTSEKTDVSGGYLKADTNEISHCYYKPLENNSEVFPRDPFPSEGSFRKRDLAHSGYDRPLIQETLGSKQTGFQNQNLSSRFGEGNMDSLYRVSSVNEPRRLIQHSSPMMNDNFPKREEPTGALMRGQLFAQGVYTQTMEQHGNSSLQRGNLHQNSVFHQKTMSIEEQIPKPSVFGDSQRKNSKVLKMKNLSPVMSRPRILAKFFGHFGNVSKVVANKAHCYSFVEFEEASEADNIFSNLNESMIFGSQIRIGKTAYDVIDFDTFLATPQASNYEFYIHNTHQMMKVKASLIVKNPKFEAICENVSKSIDPYVMYTLVSEIVTPITVSRVQEEESNVLLYKMRFLSAINAIEVVSVMDEKTINGFMVKSYLLPFNQ